MSKNSTRITAYLRELGMTVTGGDDDQLVIVENEEKGIRELFVECEPPLVILEELIGHVPDEPGNLFRRLLEMNRLTTHGAFVLDESAVRVLYRDTLEIKSLDINQLESSINGLSRALAEHRGELLGYLEA